MRSVVAVALLLTASCACGALLGIDFGSEWGKVSLVKPGVPMDVVLNVESKRKTPNSFTFHEELVLVGDPAENLASRFPSKVLSTPQQLLGQPVDGSMAEGYRAANPHAALFADPSRHTVAFRFPDVANESLTIEEVTAVILAYFKQITSAFAESEVRDAIIVVPPFFSSRERLAVLDAAKLANITVAALLNDYMAVSLNYALGQSAVVEAATAEAPHRVLFYDLGASSLKISVVQFYGRVESFGYKNKKNKTVSSFDVLSVGFDRRLGGGDFDACVLDLLAAQFQKHPKLTRSILGTPSAATKLAKYAQKVKEILSANTETPVSYESLIDDLDFSGVVSRAAFEAKCADAFSRVFTPIDAALAAANLTAAQLNEVVLVGGGARVPKVQELLMAHLGRETLEKNVNADEAAVLGAAFYGASVSISFKVKEIRWQDVNSFPIEAVFAEADGTEKIVPLFPRGSKVPAKKSVSITRGGDFTFDLRHSAGAPLASPEAQRLVARYTVSGIDAAVAEAAATAGAGAGAAGAAAPKTKLTFELSESGLARLVAAALYSQEPTAAAAAAAAAVPAAAEEEGEASAEATGSAAAAAAAATAEGESEASASASGDGATAEASASTTTTTATATATATATGTTANATAAPLKKTALAFAEDPSALALPLMTPADFAASRARLASMFARDAAKKAHAEALNQLETFVYLTKDRMGDDDVAAVTTEEQRAEAIAALEADGEWVYDGGAAADTATLRSRLVALRAIVDPAFARAKEAEKRPQAVAELKDVLSTAGKSLKRWRAETEAALKVWDEPRLSLDELDELERMLVAKGSWLATLETKQAGKAPHETPAFTVAQIIDAGEPIVRKATYYTRKPKPIVPVGPVRPPKLRPLPEDTEGANDAPVVTTLPPAEATVNETYVYNISGADVDVGDSLRFEAVYLPPWLALLDHGNGSAVVSGTPKKSGVHSVVVAVVDAAGANETYRYSLFVRLSRPPAPKTGKTSPAPGKSAPREEAAEAEDEETEETEAEAAATEAPAGDGDGASAEATDEAAKAPRDDEL